MSPSSVYGKEDIVRHARLCHGLTPRSAPGHLEIHSSFAFPAGRLGVGRRCADRSAGEVNPEAPKGASEARGIDESARMGGPADRPSR